MDEFDDFEGLADAVQKQCQDALQKVAVPLVKDILLTHIQSDIYDAYTPKANGWVSADGHPTTYERRYSLLDESAISHSFESPDTIVITSNALPSPSIGKSKFVSQGDGSFLKMLAGNNHGLWRGGFPRPAVVNAQTEVNQSADLRAALQKELETL